MKITEQLEVRHPLGGRTSQMSQKTYKTLVPRLKSLNFELQEARERVTFRGSFPFDAASGRYETLVATLKDLPVECHASLKVEYATADYKDAPLCAIQVPEVWADHRHNLPAIPRCPKCGRQQDRGDRVALSRALTGTKNRPLLCLFGRSLHDAYLIASDPLSEAMAKRLSGLRFEPCVDGYQYVLPTTSLGRRVVELGEAHGWNGKYCDRCEQPLDFRSMSGPARYSSGTWRGEDATWAPFHGVHVFTESALKLLGEHCKVRREYPVWVVPETNFHRTAATRKHK